MREETQGAHPVTGSSGGEGGAKAMERLKDRVRNSWGWLGGAKDNFESVALLVAGGWFLSQVVCGASDEILRPVATVVVQQVSVASDGRLVVDVTFTAVEAGWKVRDARLEHAPAGDKVKSETQAAETEEQDGGDGCQGYLSRMVGTGGFPKGDVYQVSCLVMLDRSTEQCHRVQVRVQGRRSMTPDFLGWLWPGSEARGQVIVCLGAE